ncbi:MAG TPA: MBL fold metallo-hydrolase [Actinomycetota bacterium]
METPHPPATSEFGFVTRGGSPHRYPPAGSLEVSKITVGDYDNNVYALRSGGEALIVDGAAEPDRILSLVEGARVVGIVQTHGHFDHVQALAHVAGALACPVYAHPDDAMPVPAERLAHGDRLQVGDIEVRVIHTPGHTPGSTCFAAAGFLFSGDTLFPGGPGNTGGEASRFEQVMTQLETHLFVLPDMTRVCPGHGLDTTIGREREHVPVWRERGW